MTLPETNKTLKLIIERKATEAVCDYCVEDILDGVKEWLTQKRQENLAVLHDKRYANGENGKQFYKGRVFEDDELLAELEK